MFSLDEVKEVSSSNATRTKLNRAKKELNSQQLTLTTIKLLFPDLQANESDLEIINGVLREESIEGYSELLGMLTEHKGILDDDSVDSFVEYAQAMKFISYVNAGEDLVDAYKKSRSCDTRQILLEASVPVLSEAEAKKNAILYSKSRLVVKLQASMDIPMHLLFTGYRYQAIEALRREMNNAPHARDRVAAADRLLHHLEEKVGATNVHINAFGDKATMNVLDTYKQALTKFAEEKGRYITEAKKDGLNRMDVLEMEDLINLDIGDRKDED